MGWGNKWIIPNKTTFVMTDEELKPFIGIDLGAGDSQTILTTWENGKIKHRVIPPEELYIEEAAPVSEHAWSNLKIKNKKPTHDPYTNPNAHIYYECDCGEILDPQTKSFAQLNNCASEKGWKIRFTDKGYVPYCVKCGEKVE